MSPFSLSFLQTEDELRTSPRHSPRPALCPNSSRRCQTDFAEALSDGTKQRKSMIMYNPEDNMLRKNFVDASIQANYWATIYTLFLIIYQSPHLSFSRDNVFF